MRPNCDTSNASTVSEMPTCPGCQQTIPHRELHVHTQYCEAIHDENQFDADSMERLEARIDAIERRLERVEESKKSLVP